MAKVPGAAPRFDVLRTIALYKIVKVILLLAVAYGERKLRDASLVAKLLSWASARAELFRLVTLAYAAVFAVEGVGLWMQKRWAEWLTVIITASLIPLEAWEIFYRPTVGKALILMANAAVVAYLVWHVRSKKRSIDA